MIPEVEKQEVERDVTITLSHIQGWLDTHGYEFTFCGKSFSELRMMMAELESIRGHKPMLSLDMLKDILIHLGYDPEIVMKDFFNGKKVEVKLKGTPHAPHQS